MGNIFVGTLQRTRFEGCYSPMLIELVKVGRARGELDSSSSSSCCCCCFPSLYPGGSFMTRAFKKHKTTSVEEE